jgi:hypothetical protein
MGIDITNRFGSFIYATKAQERTANAMAKVAGKCGLDFVINVGGKSFI